MKSSDEIKKGLETCSADECHGQHTDCPYHPDLMCIRNICADALALIQQLEKDNDQLRNYIRLLQAERDAAVAGLKSNCTCPECKYFSDDIQDPCRGCKPTDSKFEWRGVQKDESEDGKE